MVKQPYVTPITNSSFKGGILVKIKIFLSKWRPLWRACHFNGVCKYQVYFRAHL